MNVNICCNIPLDDLIDHITELSHEEIIQLIKQLDEAMEDWDATEELYKHFHKLHKLYLKECKKGE